MLEYIPYRKRDLSSVRDSMHHPYIAGHGYACVRVDLRGTGESEGVLADEYLEHDLARVGVRLHLGPRHAHGQWLGDGPHEGYSDRRSSTRSGRWSTAVDDWTVPYVHPQASGNRTGVRWLRFRPATAPCASRSTNSMGST